MEQFNKRIYDKNKTIVIFFDLEFYVPQEERIVEHGFQANPYKDKDIIIGGTFIKYLPLNEKHEDEIFKYWIWDYEFNEKNMLIDIVKLFNDSWDIVKSLEGQCDLMVCGIGISRIDLAYLFGRCIKNNIENAENLFVILNHLRIIELENLILPLFKTKNELLYPKNTSEINDKFNILRKESLA
jgi:hypothetical protein